MRKSLRILLKSAFVLALAANVQAQGIPERVSALEATVASLRAQSAAEFGIDIWEESSVAISDCTVTGSGFDGVRVAQSTFAATLCTISGSGWAGVRAEEGANVRLDTTTITANEDGVIIGDSSVLRNVLGTSITGNTSAGIPCAPSPAVPQLIGITPASSAGNPGGNFVSCAGH